MYYQIFYFKDNNLKKINFDGLQKKAAYNFSF